MEGIKRKNETQNWSYGIGTLAFEYKQGMTGSDLGFKKVVSYREVNGRLLGDWPDKVEVFQSPSG